MVGAAEGLAMAELKKMFSSALLDGITNAEIPVINGQLDKVTQLCFSCSALQSYFSSTPQKGGTYELSDIKVSKFDTAEEGMFFKINEERTGAVLEVTDVCLKTQPFSFCIDKRSFPRVHDVGKAEVELRGLEIDCAMDLHEDSKGHPQIGNIRVQLSLDDFDIAVVEGKHQKLYTKVFKLIRFVMRKVLLQSVSFALNRKLKAIVTDVNLFIVASDFDMEMLVAAASEHLGEDNVATANLGHAKDGLKKQPKHKQRGKPDDQGGGGGGGGGGGVPAVKSVTKYNPGTGKYWEAIVVEEDAAIVQLQNRKDTLITSLGGATLATTQRQIKGQIAFCEQEIEVLRQAAARKKEEARGIKKNKGKTPNAIRRNKGKSNPEYSGSSTERQRKRRGSVEDRIVQNNPMMSAMRDAEQPSSRGLDERRRQELLSDFTAKAVDTDMGLD